MCGFLAEYTFSAPVTPPNTFQTLLALSKHRGPDATNTIQNNGVQLGFNRLAILDTSPKGNQPKKSPSNRYHVVFNGELYNYKDLAETHGLTNLASTSDTEVLMHLLDKLGVETTIQTLNGMFAIVIIDTKTDLCYLTRDFAGIKPLFFGKSVSGLVAASQFNQVYKHPWHNNHLKLKPDSVKTYFALGYMQAPDTVYKDVFQVKPGELICINRQGDINKKQQSHFSKNQQDASQNQPLSSVLKNVVSKQLVSDVPIATFLSGGIDSPLIGAYAKQQKNAIEAFTLQVADAKLNESDIAKAYAKHLKIKQHIVTVSPEDVRSEIEAHFLAFSEPFGDYSSIPTYVISKEARKRHTVMLSGDGGDELFFGYPRMLDILQKRWWFKMPYTVRKPLAALTNKLGITQTWAPYFKVFNAFVFNKHAKLPKAVLDKAFKNVKYSSTLKDLYKFKNKKKTELLHQLRYNEFYAHLQRVLIKVDRASMANSLEVRVPFLDKNVIEWAWKTSRVVKTKKDLKKDLKQLLANEVPEHFINQKKMGFSVPLNHWLHNQLKTDVIKTVFHTNFYGDTIINVAALRDYVQDFYDNKHDNAWGVWHIYAWQKWWLAHGVKK
ncbi:asparagine synthase (glutamine-hydrolyzing) [Corallibacter vietnamensis]|uniref:asparagine synthase (glutamine-hydrolyzing) n=1 Tax=Corallibacter vietnamensis TaxID=904130 RepID=A0ABP7H757_9FLAO